MDKQRVSLAHYTLSTPPTPSEPSNPFSGNHFSGKDWLLLLLPFLLVGASVLYFTWAQPKPAPVTTVASARAADAQPREFEIEKYLVPKHGEIQIVASNHSDEAVTIPQVIADDAYWAFSADPSTLVPAGGVVTFTLPYPWVTAELPEVRLITSRGETIDSEVEPTLESTNEVTATTSPK
jgi:hypothetical protein